MRQRQHATGGDPDLFAEGLGDAAGKARGFLRNAVVQPLQIERQHFTPVTADDLQLRVAVECAGQDEAQQMDAGLVVPAPAEHGQPRRQFG